MDSPGDASDALARGETARRERRLDDATRDFSAAIAIFRTAGQAESLAHALTRRAQIARDARDFDKALRDQDEALDIFRMLGDPLALAKAVRHFADILQDAGRHEEAAPYFDEMLAIYRAHAETPALEYANAIRSVALHAEHRGLAAEARLLWTEARARYNALDDVFLELTGKPENPGVREADRRLAILGCA